jgi:hypothetical protein
VDPYEQEIQERLRRREAILRQPMVQQAIAQLRVAQDRLEGRPTPQWIHDLADDTPPPDAP